MAPNQIDILQLFPEYQTMSDEAFIEKVPYNLILSHILEISEYYNKKVHLHHTLKKFGISITPGRIKQYVKCLFPSHSTADHKPSAEYFDGTYDANGNWVEQPRVWCFKCNCLTVGSFAYVRQMFKDNNTEYFREILQWFLSEFNVRPPREIILSSTTETEQRTQISWVDRIKQAREKSKLKSKDKQAWLASLEAIHE